MMSRNKVLSNYAWVLEMLLRMRQCCDHASLVPEDYRKGGFESEASEQSEKNKMLVLLEESVTEKCAICGKSPAEDPCVTPCLHYFCKDCLEEHLDLAKPSQSPVCKMPCAMNQVVTMETAEWFRKEQYQGKSGMSKSVGTEAKERNSNEKPN